MSRHRDDAAHARDRLGEPATEQYVGRRDLTHWSRPVRAFVRLVLRISRNSSAWHVLLVTAAVGAGIALLLNWAAEEIYDSVKAADGLSSLDEPVLELAISLRTPHNVAVAQFITNLGGAIGVSLLGAVQISLFASDLSALLAGSPSGGAAILQEAFAQSISSVFWIVLGVSVATFVAVLLMKRLAAGGAPATLG